MSVGNEMSICIWNYGITAVGSSAYSSKDSLGARTVNVHLPWSDNVVYWDCGTLGGSYDRINTSTLNDSQWKNSWHYWTFTKNVSTGNMSIYLDGTVLVTSNAHTMPISSSVNAYIGATWDLSGYINSKIATVSIYNKSLTSAEVLQNYNATKNRFGL